MMLLLLSLKSHKNMQLHVKNYLIIMIKSFLMPPYATIVCIQRPISQAIIWNLHI